MSPAIEGLLEAGLEAIRGIGGAAELYLQDTRRVKVVVSGGEVESVQERHERGAAVRLFEDGRVGFAFTTDLGEEGIARAASEARTLARQLDRDEAWQLPPVLEAAPLPFPQADPRIGEIPMARRIELASAMEEAARKFDPRVGRARQSVLTDIAGEVAIGHTGGLRASHRFSRAVAYIQLTATENGKSQAGSYARFALGPEAIAVEDVGREAARRALARLGAKPGSTATVPVVLDREVVAGLLDELAPAFSGQRVLRKTSPLAGRLGEKVASEAVTILDDPRLPGGYGSAPIDGEGVPTRRLVLVEQGALQGFLHDTYSAVKLGLGQPGNAVRGSYLGPPRIGPRNLLLLPGRFTREELVERAGEGVLVEEVMGLHTVDPTTADFSLGANGSRIARGRLAEPIETIAFSGNLIGLLRSIVAVGSDFELFPGGGGAASVLVEAASIAGAG